MSRTGREASGLGPLTRRPMNNGLDTKKRIRRNEGLEARYRATSSKSTMLDASSGVRVAMIRRDTREPLLSGGKTTRTFRARV